MLNVIWGGMVLIGIIVGILSRNVELVSNAALDSAGEAVQLCITMLGIMSVWTGLMEIAKESGMIRGLTKKSIRFLRFLFPGVPKDHEAMELIALNMVSNFLGLGWAATPAGLKAMKLLAQINPHKEKRKASADMCTFLIINVSSLQLIPVSIIAYRSQYGAVNPAQILVPAILATTASTLAGVIYSIVARKVHKE